MNIEVLKEILENDKLHICLGQIVKLHLASDRSYLKVTILRFPEQVEAVATMTWENVGPDSGDFEFPSAGDLVLCAQSEGDYDQCYVIKRLTSKTDKIPEEAITGDKVHRAKAGKKYWNVSDSKIYLSRDGTAPTENVVLGQVFKTFAQDVLLEVKDMLQTLQQETHTCSLPGYLSSVPTQTADYAKNESNVDGYKASPIDDEAVLSDLSYTEK